MIEKSRREYLIHRIKKNSIAVASGCIEWTATKNNQGYGIIHFAIESGDGYKASTTAHRAHYMAHHNVILTRWQFVCHRCDNPACVNVAHLFIGSPIDNHRDKLAKNRHAKSYALHTRRRVHSDELILAIRIASGSLKDIAAQYGVSIGYASKIRNNQAKTLVK